MRRKLSIALLVGAVGTPIFGYMAVSDYRGAFAGDGSVWWTPADTPLSLDQTQGVFRIYLEDESLQQQLARGALTGLGKDGMAYFVTPDMLRVRVNSWDRVRASILEAAVYSAFGLGVSLSCLVLGLAQLLREPAPPRRRVAGARPRPIRR